MKRTILLLTVLGFISYQSHAQINEGRIQVGGSIGASGGHLEEPPFQPEYKASGINVSPSVGWFYKTNKMMGLSLSFGYLERNQTSKLISRSFGGGVFFRQYQPVLNKLYVFLEENAAYSYSSANFDETHSYDISASLQAGMAYDISKKMQLELSLDRLVSGFYQKGQASENYGVSTSLEKDQFSSVGFGFRYYLR